MNRKKEYKLNYLSAEFYKKYSTDKYPEIENKENRPYMVLLIKVDNNTFAIPFRTNIKHHNCYKFKNSTRPTDTVTGLDYTKAVVVNDDRYIDAPARINDKEYTELNDSYGLIIRQFKGFVADYITFVNGTHRGYYNTKKFRFTTLQYFHQELGIKQK